MIRLLALIGLAWLAYSVTKENSRSRPMQLAAPRRPLLPATTDRD